MGPPMSMTEVTQVTTQNGAAKKRKQRPMVAKFPATMNFGITLAMAEGVQRLSPPSSPFTQSDIGRIALHSYLLSNDELYRRAIAADGMNGGAHA